MEYVAFALWCFAVAAAGGLVGLVLGNIRLPAVLLLASSPAAGAGANLGISAVSAATASTAHVRAGRVNWTLFAWMAPPSVLGALAGGYLSGVVPGDVLMLSIGAVLLYSAADLFRWKRPARTSGTGERRLNIAAAVITGAVIGLLGGFIGLILGSLRMPALIRFVGESPARAIGTNVTIGFCVGIAGVIGHLGSSAPDWDVLAVGAAASIPGALVGSRLTGRLSEAQLVRAVAAVLLVAGTVLIVQAIA